VVELCARASSEAQRIQSNRRHSHEGAVAGRRFRSGPRDRITCFSESFERLPRRAADVARSPAAQAHARPEIKICPSRPKSGARLPRPSRIVVIVEHGSRDPISSRSKYLPSLTSILSLAPNTP
jgi:hypothetical protein